jgi:hypothetical protein
MARTLDNLGPIPTKLQPDSDTEPEPFGSTRPSHDADTKPRCVMCGAGPFDTVAEYDRGYDDAVQTFLSVMRRHRLDGGTILTLEVAIRHRLGQI